jgi:hypothetical protein
VTVHGKTLASDDERLSGNNGEDVRALGRTVLPRSQRCPLPDPEVFEKWLCGRFAGKASGPILIINGFGEKWKRPKRDSIIMTACHPDINYVQLKTFHRILLLREIACEYSVDPVIYIMVLGHIARGFNSTRMRENVAETRRFLEGVFSKLGKVTTIVDRSKVQADDRSIFRVIDFDRDLEKILKQMRTPNELEKTEFFGEKGTALTQVERKLLKIYLFERRMLDEEQKKYPYISWGHELQADVDVSYNIYDESNAGAAILRKLVSIENGKEYPGTIVLPDPLTISGKPMRYQIQQRDLRVDEALLLSDTFADVKRKLVDQKNVSNEFLDYLVTNILQPFAASLTKKELDQLTNLKTDASHNAKQQLVLRHYWRFIKPYYDEIETITGFHEGLFVHEEFVENVFNALGSKRNRIILQTIATYYRKYHDGLTAAELSQKMGFNTNRKRSIYRNLHQLQNCGLVMVVGEGDKLKRYFIYGKKALLQIRWPFCRSFENQ